MRRLKVALLVGCAAVGAALAVSAMGAPAADVTIRLERFYDNGCRCYKLRFSGTVASAAANEYVAVLQQKCGQRGSTAIAGASTQPGGSWEADPVMGARPGQDSSTYRARWRGRVSRPLRFRAELAVSLASVGARRYRASVTTVAVPQRMTRRIVELQRLSGGRWTSFQRARLVARLGAYSAVFTVRQGGLTLRAFVPARSASPCYLPSVSQTLVSGQAAPTSGANVVDRSFLCEAASRGGIRQVSIEALAGVNEGTGAHPPSFNLSSTWVPDGSLANGSIGQVSFNPTRCTETRTSVPLTTRGLRGGSPGPFGQAFKCETPTRVLVRVRASFRTPATIETLRDFGYPILTARGDVRDALLAMRTPAGKQLAFASVSESGQARLLTAPSCTEGN